MRTLMLIIAASLVAAAQTQIDLRTQAKSVDFTAASSTKPLKTGSVLPPTCSAGAMFYKTDAPAGQNLYGCTAIDTWTQMSGGGNVSTGAMNTFTRGQIINGSQDQVQLDISGNGTQTNPVFRVRTSGGANLIQANNDGSVDLGSGSGPNILINQAAPGAAPAGKTAVWTDSTDKVLKAKDEAGNTSVTVRPNACPGQVVQSVGTDGTITCGAAGGGTATDSLFLGFGSCENANAFRAGRWGFPATGGKTSGPQCNPSWVLSNPLMESWNSTTELGLEMYAPFVIPSNINTSAAPVFRIKGAVTASSTGNIKLSAKLACQPDDTSGQTALAWSTAGTAEVGFTPTNQIIKNFALTLSWPSGCAANQTAVLSLARVAASSSEYSNYVLLFDGQLTYGVQ